MKRRSEESSSKDLKNLPPLGAQYSSMLGRLCLQRTFLGYPEYVDRKQLQRHLNQLELSLASAVAGHAFATSSHEIV